MAKEGIGIMCRIVAALVLGIAITGYAETVTNVLGSQRPNVNLVDIYYDLNAVDGGAYTVEVSIEGRTNEVTATTFSGDVGKGIAPGKNRHIVWEAGADWRGNKGDVKAVVTASIEAWIGKKPGKVQLWEGGPYWADRNIGADNPWDYGLYFWWGDTTGHRPTGMTFSFSFEESNCPTYGKTDATLQSEGWITEGGVLVPNNDAAHAHWGGSWRMPTYQELYDLCHKNDWTWATMNGVKGYVVRGRGDYASNSIFLPCAGYGLGTSFGYAGSLGFYWSSVYQSQYGSGYISLKSGSYNASSHYRAHGFSVRPVQ